MQIFQFVLLVLFATLIQSEPCFETTILRFDWLTTPRYNFGTVFDGEDDIYLLGGRNAGSYLDGVLRYRISSGRVQIVDTFANETADGSAEITPNGDVFLIGSSGFYASSTIWGFNVADPRPTHVGDMPNDQYNVDTVFDGEHTIYAFGGAHHTLPIPDQIYRIDTDNIDSPATVVATLPAPTYGTSSVWVNGAAYIFGGYRVDLGYVPDIVKFIPGEGSKPARVETLPQKLSSGIIDSMAVAVGDVIYVLGGNEWLYEEQHYLTRFNTVTGVIEHFEVNLGNAWVAGGAVYVPETHRIYILGGWGVMGSESAQIRYIQLSHDDNCELP